MFLKTNEKSDFFFIFRAMELTFGTDDLQIGSKGTTNPFYKFQSNLESLR